jgi:hypothetical protein
MDGFTINTMSPQEDEFALLALGVPSVYRGFFDPRRLSELVKWLNPESWAATNPDGWTDAWIEFLKGVNRDTSLRLVLKSPSHTFRINALTSLFPNSAFVWLVRDPIDTFLSNRKMWISMFDRYSLWNYEPSALDSFLGKALGYASDILERAIRTLPKERFVVVGFGDLTRSPVDAMERLNKRLLLGDWNAMRSPLSPIACAKNGYSQDSYDRSQVPNDCIREMNRLNSIQVEALSSHGV